MSEISKTDILLNELMAKVAEIKDMLLNNQYDEILKRLERLEREGKNANLKLDAISSLDITPTLVVPNAPTTIKVAGGGSTATGATAASGSASSAPSPGDDGSEVSAEKKKFSNITEFFKHMYVTDPETLYLKNIITREGVAKVMEENREKFEKKTKDNMLLQKTIASTIYKTLTVEVKNKLKSLQQEVINNMNKANSKEIVLPAEN